jgi:hypothetical protein
MTPVAMGTDAPAPHLDMNRNLVQDSNGNTVTRWGDYLAVRPFAGAGPLWIASGYVLQGGKLTLDSATIPSNTEVIR